MATVQLEAQPLEVEPAILAEPAETAASALRRWIAQDSPSTESGLRAAWTLARAVAVGPGEFNEWIGWELLRLVDEDDALGVHVTVQPADGGARLRLRDYVPYLAARRS